MRTLATVYRLFNLLSLDVVAGAMVSALFFARLLHVHLLPYGLAALGLTVWIVYTVDHLRDARNIHKRASTERHRFHQQHFNVLLIGVNIAIFINAIMIFFIRDQVLKAGIVLAVGVGIYLAIQRYLKFLKEVFIACGYTCGVLLPSATVTPVVFKPVHYLIIAQFAVLALINLLMFAWFDRDHDKADKQNSFVVLAGERATRICLWVLLTSGGVMTLVALATGSLPAASLTLGAMGLIFLLIFVFRDKLAHDDLYRLFGDAAFMFPILYLLWDKVS